MSARSRRIGGGLAAALLVLCAAAWFDGGHEPLHPIERAVELPETAR